MSFGLFPSMPFVPFVGTVTSAWLNFVRASLPDTVDGVGGGTYNLLPGHTLDFPAGGGVITIEAPFAFTDGDIPVGGHLDVEGTVRINSGGTLDVKSGGIEYVRSGGQIDVKSGGLITMESGSNCNMLGHLNVDGGGTIFVGVDTVGQGHIVVDGTGTAAGSSIALQNGALFGMSSSAAAQWATSATLTMLSTAGAALFQNAVTMSGTAVLSGTNTLSGPTTQTAAYTKSGTGAYTRNRAVIVAAHGPGGATDPDLTIDGADSDIFTLAANISALGQDMILTVATNVAAAGHRFTIRASSVTPGFNTIVQTAGGLEIGALLDNTGAGVASPPYFGGAIDFYYSASGVPTRIGIYTGIDSGNPLHELARA